MLALASQQCCVITQELVGPRDHVAERAQSLGLKHAFNLFENRRDFLATSENLFVRQAVRIFRLADAGNRELTAFQPVDVLRIFFRAHQLVVTAPHEIQQVIEKLGNVGGTDEVVQTKIPDTLSQVDPQVFVVEDSEGALITLQQLVAIGMESRRTQVFDLDATKFRLHALAHLRRGILGVGE